MIEHMIDTVGWLRDASQELARLAAAPRRESIQDNVQLVADCQALLNRLQAVQAVAMATVSGIEDVIDPATGEVVEQFRGFDHARMDAPALVSDALGVSDQGANTRMHHATALAGTYPTVLAAMATGRVDSYRAGIIVTELDQAPDQVREAVVAQVLPRLGEEPGHRLRQRVRRVLGKVGEQFLRHKAARARTDRSLRRWAGEEPGVDTWTASLPVEEAGRAWAAINTLAREYVTTGECSTVEQARADAMLALIQGNARAEYVIQVAVPESRLAPTPHPHDEPNPHADSTNADSANTDSATSTAGAPARAGAGAGAGVDQVEADKAALDRWVKRLLTETGYVPAEHGNPTTTTTTTSTTTTDAASEGDRSEHADRQDRQECQGDEPAPGATGSSSTAKTAGVVALPVLVPRRVRIDVVPCDDTTGAFTRTPIGSWTITANMSSDGAGVEASTLAAAFADAVVRSCKTPEPTVVAYRPTEAMIRTVKARDGGCRFPGCTVAARFCDLDHVVAWKENGTGGPTTVANLICLCRRHHRTKQQPRWSVRILPGALLQWTDPTGRVRTTHPVNHLDPDPTPWLDNHGTEARACDTTDDTTTDTAPVVEFPSPAEDHFDWLIDRWETHGPQHRTLHDRETGRPLGTLTTTGKLHTIELTDDYAAHLATRTSPRKGYHRPAPDEPPPF